LPSQRLALFSRVVPRPAFYPYRRGISEAQRDNLGDGITVVVSSKGRRLGETPLVEVPLPIGTHLLTLTNEALGLRTVIEVEIEEGQTTAKHLKF